MSVAFDREFTLVDLLPPTLLARLAANLAQLLDAPLALLDAQGHLLWGETGPADTRHPLVLELEPLGYLVTAAAPQRTAAALRLFVELLMTRRRYLMASLLHTEVVAADHAELQRQASAVATATEQLQDLSASIDSRLREQTARVERSQRQIFQTEKLASVAQLAAGVAHEINNPVGFVRSNLNTLGNYLAKIALLRGRLAQAETAWGELDLEFVIADGSDLIHDCIAGLDRVTRIVADLKGFSNVDRPEETISDINEGLRAACTVIETRKPPGVELTLDAGELPAILCLPGHLNQAFLNVLTNAMQAVGEHGAIHVESRLLQDGADDARQIVVRIRDDGVGIAPKVLPRVFDPFFTTRDVGQGTGLGLTVARDVVEVHGGHLDIESTPGKGTLVTIRLPA